MTEEQAKTKICPLFIGAVMIVKSHSGMSREGVEKLTTCIVSDCMMWKWIYHYQGSGKKNVINASKTDNGYCGLTHTT